MTCKLDDMKVTPTYAAAIAVSSVNLGSEAMGLLSKLIDSLGQDWLDKLDLFMGTTLLLKKRQIVFAGAMTSGDGPDPESAWGICEMVDSLHLLEVMGIR